MHIELAIGLEDVALSLNTDGASLLLSNNCDRDGCEMSVVPSTVSETTLIAARYAVTWRIRSRFLFLLPFDRRLVTPSPCDLL
jgi:hypothetical protein